MTGSRRAAEAAATVEGVRRELARRGSNILREALGDAGGAAAWRHYPDGDAYDAHSHAQYFFHRHASDAPDEAGHFHLFLRAEGMPAGTMPLLLPEAAIANLPTPPQAAPFKRGTRDEVCHLVAIAITAAGEPVRLFTTNRWVTGETWYRAEDVIRTLDRFSLDAAEPAGLLNRWLVALVRLYQPEIAMLLRRRDEAVMDPRRRRRRVEVFEDPKLEVTSSLGIDLDQRLTAVARLAVERPVRQPALPPRLPPMAEGWGS
ncbi:MAG: hypothetical protein JO032_02820 [Alphaproteobacteria bacterium]|nr:hypothetical protein [Alphaproteobacteria bacterium]